MVVVVAVSWRRPTLLAISAEPPGGERASITAPSLSPEPSGEPDTAKLRMYHLEKIRTGDKLQGGEEKKPWINEWRNTADGDASTQVHRMVQVRH